MTISPRQFTSRRHPRSAGTWPAIPLQPFANARLLLGENASAGDTTSAVVASHVLECVQVRSNYLSG